MTKNEIKKFISLNATGKVSESLLEFIATHIGSVPYISLEQLSMETNTNVSDIIDFFKTLGFDSFISFKTYLRKTNYFELKNNRTEQTDIRNIATKMMQCELQNLNEFFSDFDYALLDQLVEDITAASEVVLLGFRGGSAYSVYAMNMFSKVGIKTTIMNIRDANFIDFLSTLNRSALLITFGFARYNKSLIIANTILKKQGFHMVGLTDSIHSPIAAVADYSFVLPVHSVDFSDSFTAGMLLINMITFRIGLTNKDKMLKSIENSEQLSSDFDSFF